MMKLISQLTSLFLLLATAQPAVAQVKPTVFGQGLDKKTFKLIVFQPFKDSVELECGTLVTLTLNDETQITGHVVYLDAKAKRLFVRTAPGAAPMSYLENDIEKISKTVRSDDTIGLAGLARD